MSINIIYRRINICKVIITPDNCSPVGIKTEAPFTPISYWREITQNILVQLQVKFCLNSAWFWCLLDLVARTPGEKELWDTSPQTEEGRRLIPRRHTLLVGSWRSPHRKIIRVNVSLSPVTYTLIKNIRYKTWKLFAFTCCQISNCDFQAVAVRTCDHQQLGSKNLSQQPQLFRIPDLWGVWRDLIFLHRNMTLIRNWRSAHWQTAVSHVDKLPHTLLPFYEPQFELFLSFFSALWDCMPQLSWW